MGALPGLEPDALFPARERACDHSTNFWQTALDTRLVRGCSWCKFPIQPEFGSLWAEQLSIMPSTEHSAAGFRPSPLGSPARSTACWWERRGIGVAKSNIRIFAVYQETSLEWSGDRNSLSLVLWASRTSASVLVVDRIGERFAGPRL